MSCNSTSRAFSNSPAWGCIVIGILSCLALALAAQTAMAPAVVSMRGSSAAAVKAGGTAEVKLVFAIAPGFHIQSNHPNSPYLIPTTLAISPASGVSVAAVRWPQAQELKLAFSPDPLAVFSGSLPVNLELRAAANASGTRELNGTLRYQACTATLCRPPATLPVHLTVHVQ